MKKIITALALTTALGLSIFAQPGSATTDKDKRPSFGPGMENCDGMGPMHKGMDKMHGKSGKEFRNGCDGEDCGAGPMMFEKLDLNKEQLEKVHQIRIKYEKADIDLKAELKKLRIDKHEAMSDLNFEKAKEITKKMADVKTKTQLAQIEEMSEITKVLSKEQLDKFREMHKKPGMMKHKMMK